MDQEPWPSGLRVMVVDNDSSYLSLMEQLLLKCSYKVTTYKHVEEAVSFISGNQQTTDLIISDVFFPNEDGLLILQEITSKFDIPTVMMSSTGDTSIVMKYITNGASNFLIKPVRIEELKNIWQHVFRKQVRHHKKNVEGGHEQFYDASSITSFTPRLIEGVETTATKNATREVNIGIVTDIRNLTKSRLSWTKQLHRQFIAAVNFLGPNKAVPTKILEIMKVKHLTREQVASHLQKYRLQLRKPNHSIGKDDATSSTIYGGEPNTSPKSQNDASRYVYFDQDGCIQITDYSLLNDDLSSGSECMLGEQSNYAQGDSHDFKSDSEKQSSDQSYNLWNFSSE